MSPKKQILPALFVLAAAVISGGWLLQEGVEREQNLFVQARLFNEIVEHISERFVDEVDRGELYGSAIDGLIGELDDPNTAFLSAADYENLRIRTEGEYGGVGLEIVARDGWVTVVAPLPGTPGARAGIRAGDRIIEVEGQSMEDWSVERAVERLRGSPGSSVDVKIRRPGVDTPIPFELTRAVITVRSVPFATMVSETIGYVPLNTVAETSTQEVRAAIDSLRNGGMTGLILDLRGNPGGLLDQGVALTDVFVERRTPVVETRGRAPGQSETFRASRGEVYPDLPLVILIDERSASASEIVAGALQDHDRALIVGARSFGKGSVQTLYRLSGGNVLKLTTARWFTPSGRSIQKPREEQVAVAEHGVLTLDGSFTARPQPDEDRPTVTSTNGRTLIGGGGITPDVVVLPDTLTSQEQAAVRTLYREAGVFSLGLFNFVVRYLQEHPDLSESFQVTDVMVRDFHDYLKAQGLHASDEVFHESERFVAYQLGQEIALQKWGEIGRFRFLAPDDRQLQAATSLLEEASTPQSLFTVAAR